MLYIHDHTRAVLHATKQGLVDLNEVEEKQSRALSAAHKHTSEHDEHEEG